jgi:molybdenum cofactor cytidylyltransferase
LTAVILAAGFSRRFGKEKLLMRVYDKPIILHVVDSVLEMGFRETILVYRNEEILKAVSGRKMKSVYNSAAADGISSSIKCGLRLTRSIDDYIFFTGDMPFINFDTVTQLLKAFHEGMGSIIVPRYGGYNGNPVIFASKWKGKLENLSGDTGGRTIIKGNQEEVYFVDIQDLKAGMDIDTMEEYYRQNEGAEQA